MSFKPAFEVTKVKSMQWNRTKVNFELPAEPAADEVSIDTLPSAVREQLRNAIQAEAAR
ncbi:hypothetical protein [Streptomyces canus]|uniref:Uncharacterized protein n=1 Tax=Streptomyces canus TaxID=58343 RepID=A0AAW8FCN7_9ACTN|nr:hypothetical protein [Streptomyces canus]MDQ0764966.1 hypothetical protein [Streptomyces canus]MDQ0906578.1 hypothetical protein [Streptomyces canus]MDQ1066598.1 hypothetical protein [Streptomyces canus]